MGTASLTKARLTRWSFTFVKEVGLMMGHAVYATYLIYQQMMKQYCPTVTFRFPFHPRLAVHPQSVLMAFRYDTRISKHQAFDSNIRVPVPMSAPSSFGLTDDAHFIDH
jgi:hypothetical protein